MLRIKVKLFAAIRDAAGVNAVEVDAHTVADAARALSQQFPAAAQLIARSRFAVNQSFAPAETMLGEHDEVAVIPPVSGG